VQSVSFLLLGTGLVVDLVKLRAGLGVAFVPITTVFVINGTGLDIDLVIVSSGQ
jgi:hypothetical protein